jgi:hypothetical protein
MNKYSINVDYSIVYETVTGETVIFKRNIILKRKYNFLMCDSYLLL